MAKATAVTVQTTSIVLELTEDEAILLVDIFQVIGGDCHNTRRKLADVMGAALDDAGVDRSGYDQNPRLTRAGDLAGTLTFS